jgi:hypothetical protein
MTFHRHSITVGVSQARTDDLAKRNHWSRKARLPITEAP